MKKSLNYYKNNINKVNDKLQKLEKKLLAFSVIRFIVVIISFISMYYYYKKNSIEGIGFSFICGLTIFLVIAFFHNEKINYKKKLLTMLKYYENGIKRLDGTWKEFNDIGKEFIDRNHNFSSDLDIFGKSSLFQWINITKTSFGRKKLANKMMINNLPTRYEIQDNQEAIRELASKRGFCEKIYFVASIENKKKENIEELLKWAKSEEKNSFTTRYISYIFIAITAIIILERMLWQIITTVLPFSAIIHGMTEKSTLKMEKSLTVAKSVKRS